MRPKCLLAACVLFLVAVRGRAQETLRTLRETFGPERVAEFADRWETVGGAWQVRDGALRGASPSARGFAYLPDVPEAPRMDVRARLRVAGRDTDQGWAVAGVTVFMGQTDFWQLALVEGPDDKRYVELVEMFAGGWQAQRDGEHALKQTESEGQWTGWERGRDYDVSLAVSATTVTGAVTDPATGKTVTRITYEWGNARGVKSGRPGVVTSGFRIDVGEVTANWTASADDVVGLDVQDGERGALAMLADSATTGRGADCAQVARAFRTGGYGVTPLTCTQLATPGVLDARRFDALVLPASPRFPVAAMDSLLHFLRAGGDLVLMGGLPFSEPLFKTGDQWLTRADVEAQLAEATVQQPLFDFEAANAAEAWKRSSNHLDQPSQASTVAGPTGNAMLLDIRGLDGWDTFAVGLPDGLAAASNALCFRANATATTPAMIVELKEADGSRWIAKVELSPAWRSYVVPNTRFEFWDDGSPTGRGQAGDVVRFEQARSLSFGLAGSHIDGIQGDHRLWIDEIGTAHVNVPDTSLAADQGLNVFSDYRAYRMTGVTHVASCRSETVPDGLPEVSMSIACQGWSAVGFAFPNESVFVPLLSAEDSASRLLGWAGGALVNQRGTYRNSTWLLFGVETPEFYLDAGFLKELPTFLTQLGSSELVKRLRVAESSTRKTSDELTTPPPHSGFIRRSDDGRHLVYPDGKRFFMIGCNYVGGFTRCGGRMWADSYFDAREVEDDFRKAREAGLNVMRYWLQSTLDQDLRAGNLGKVNTIRECARRYGVYLLLDLPGTAYTTEADMLASHRAIAEAFSDEPMVLGYDLRNEPYVTTLGGIRYTDNKPPVQTVDLTRAFPGIVDMDKVDAWIEERPWWLHLSGCIKGEEARRVTAASVLWGRYLEEFDLRSSSVRGLGTTVPVGRWQPLLDVVDKSLDQWIDTQVTALREVDPNHLITVGHNTALCILPANARLDFVSKHIYVRPYSYDNVMENITTLDRLKARWPDQPITLGEFGYSNGIILGDGYLDPHTSSVGEMVHFLYAFANDYDGCKKWMLVDWPLAVMRHYGDWNRGLPTRIYEERFGLFSYDGTRHGRPKPIVHALRFFRGLADRMAPGGILTVTHDASPIGAGYVFRAPHALFVGGRQANLPELRFRCDDTVNVMLDWSADSVHMMATADVTVDVDVGALVPFLPRRQPAATGTLAPPTVRDGRWTLSLAAGKTAVLK